MSHSNGIGSLQNLLSSVDLSGAKQVAAAKVKSENGVSTSSAAKSADQAVLSTTGSVMAQALRGSDVRMEKVAALKQAIEAGTYKVAASDVANKLMESMLK